MYEADLSIGIIGFGLRAGLYRYLHQPGEGSSVTVVCDISERGRSDAIEKIPGVNVTDSIDDVVASGVDAAVVLVPDYAHAAVAIPLLRAGIAVFCEKPLDITVEAADSVLRAAYETGTKLYVGHNMRHMPVIRQMRELITAGAIGEVRAIWCRHFVGNGGDYYFKDWHAERSKANSLLLQKGAHDIDVIHWLAGGYSRRVAAMGKLAVYGNVTSRRDNSDRRMGDWFSTENWPPLAQTDLNPILDVEDISMMNMELDNGVLASYQQCHFTPDYWRNYTIIGTAGRIENFDDGPGGEIKLYGSRGQQATETFAIAGENEAGHGGADPSLIAEFLNFVRHGGHTDTNPVAAREAVAAAAVAAESLRSDGGALDVPDVPQSWQEYFDSGQRRSRERSQEVALGGDPGGWIIA